MNFFAISGDVAFRQIDYDKELVDWIRAHRGQTLASHWPEVSLVTLTGTVKKGIGLGDCPYFVAGILIVSERFRSVVEDVAPGDVEFLPVRVDGVSGFSYMNILRVLDALNVERSELRRFEDGAIKYVARAEFHADFTTSRHIFLLPNYGGVYISNLLRARMEHAGIIGAEYRDVGIRVENPFEELFARQPTRKRPPVIKH